MQEHQENIFANQMEIFLLYKVHPLYEMFQKVVGTISTLAKSGGDMSHLQIMTMGRSS